MPFICHITPWWRMYLFWGMSNSSFREGYFSAISAQTGSNWFLLILQTAKLSTKKDSCCYGKNLVFAMTIKLIPEFWRNQEIPEKFWKTYEQVKLDLFQNFYWFLILFLIPEFCHPEPRPTRSYLTYYV